MAAQQRSLNMKNRIIELEDQLLGARERLNKYELKISELEERLWWYEEYHRDD